MCVGLVAPEGDDAQRAVGTGAEEDGPTDRLFGCQPHPGPVDPEPRERPLDLADRRSTHRRAERVFHRVGHAPAEDDGGDQVGGEAT